MNQIEYQNREDTYPEESAENGPRIVILWDLLKVNTFAVINSDILLSWTNSAIFKASKLELNNANSRFVFLETIKTFRTHRDVKIDQPRTDRYSRGKPIPLFTID